jgi:hypothetical protein
MASRTLTLVLGGKERTLCFGRFGFTENIQEITGEEPFEYFKKMAQNLTPKQQFELVNTITYAALLSQCDYEGRKPDFNKEDVFKWVKGLEFSEAATILNDCVSAINSLFEPGEVQAQTNHKEALPITN